MTAQPDRKPLWPHPAAAPTALPKCDRFLRSKTGVRSAAKGRIRVMKSAAERVTSAAEGLPRRRFTVAEVEAMVAAGVMEEDERVELIGGELVPMSPKGNQHEVVKIALAERWYRARPEAMPPRRRETTFRLSEDTYLEPDVVIFPRASGTPRPRPPTTSFSLSRSRICHCDTTWAARPALYASFGVRELWVIDAAWLTARVLRDPAPDGYRETLDFGPGDLLAPLFRTGSVRAAARRARPRMKLPRH